MTSTSSIDEKKLLFGALRPDGVHAPLNMILRLQGMNAMKGNTRNAWITMDKRQYPERISLPWYVCDTIDAIARALQECTLQATGGRRNGEKSTAVVVVCDPASYNARTYVTVDGNHCVCYLDAIARAYASSGHTIILPITTGAVSFDGGVE